MLVLSRKLGQSIQIGDDVVVTVVRVEGLKVRLGIEAPQSVRIVRTELEQELQKLEEFDAELTQTQPQQGAA